MVSKYLQVKTSEGIEREGRKDERSFSFHPKIRYLTGDDVFYVWIAVFQDDNDEKKCHFYIFNSRDVGRFDDMSLPTYQITDNQKTTLIINREGKVLSQGKKYDYSCFNNEFHNNWRLLEKKPG